MRLHTIIDYNAQRYELLKLIEADVEHLYVDNSRGARGVAHIGIGVNLNPAATNHSYLALQYLGFDLAGTVLTGAALDAEQKYILDMEAALRRDYPKGTDRDNKGFTEINKILQKRLDDPSYAGAPTNFVRVSSFELTKGVSNQTGQLFEQMMKGYEVKILRADGTLETRKGNSYESALDDWLSQTLVAVKNPGLLVHGSKERLVLLSMLYNGPGRFKSGIGKALLNDDRAEAWYVIRYASNTDARRKYIEADYFGLFNDGALGDEDYKSAYRMFTRHRDEPFTERGVTYNGILDYESRNSPASWGAGSIQNELSRPYIPLRVAYGQGADINPLNIFVGENNGEDGTQDTRYYKGTDADNIIGTGESDLIFGESGHDTLLGYAGDDVIYGGSGNDWLYGGYGSDILLGGKGNDTYVIYDHETGQDRIEDKEGNNTVIFNGIALKYFVKKSGETVWRDLDKRFTAEMQGTDLVVRDTQVGNSVILNENFENGDFGIRLLDLPAEPTDDTSTGPTSFWGSAPPNVAVSSTKTITTKIVSGPNGAYSYTQTPDPLPPYATDSEILFKSEQVSSSTVTTGQGTPETTDDTSTTVTVDQWYYRGPQTQMIDDDGGHTFSADAVTTLMDGQGGDDSLNGRGVNGITLLGGAGNDSLYNGYIIRGGDGNDFIDGYGGPGFYYGEAGNDFIYYYYTDPAGNSVADGGSGSDLIFGEAQGDNHFIGGDNDDPLDEGDLIISVFGNDFLEGGNGNDILFDYLGADILYGGAGDDYLFGNASAGYVERYVWSIVTPVTDIIAGVQFDGSHYEFPPFEFAGIYFTDYDPKESDNLGDVILGGAGNDYLMGGRGDDLLDVGTTEDEAANTNTAFAGFGNDVLSGGAGRDWLHGDDGDDQIFGGDGDDMLFGDEVLSPDGIAGNDSIEGGAGDDKVYGHGGDDILSGGDGIDYVVGSAGRDLLYGGDGDDELYGDSDDTDPDDQLEDTLFGDAGDDILVGSGGSDVLFGGTGDDMLYGDVSGLDAAYHGDDVLSGDEGNDLLAGSGGNDLLFGGDGDDQLFGDDQEIAGDAHGADVLAGGSGNDVLVGGGGSDELYGDDGNDYLLGDDNGLSFAYQQGDYLDGGAGNDTLYGMGGNDNLAGGAGNDWLYGDTGNDTVSGGDGDDWLYAGAGNDTLEGDDGWDTYVFGLGDGSDTIADAGDNTLFFNFGMGIYDLELFVGSLGIRIRGTNDEIHIAGFDPDDPYATSSITRFEFADGNVQTLEEFLAQGFDINGTSDDDILIGTALTDRLNGYAGNDILIGKAGNDFLSGGTGNDNADGGDGDDQVAGDEGDDQLSGGAGQDVLDGGEGSDTLDGGEGHDRLLGGIGDDALLGGDGSDVLDGGAGADSMIGGAGNDEYHVDSAADIILENPDGGLVDRVYSSVDYSLADNVEELLLEGGALNGTGNALDNVVSGTVSDNLLIGLGGNDTVRGWEGNDQLLGGDGDDSLYGGIGDDHLEGGAGNDTLYGDEGSNHLFGGDGNDDLHGGSASDILDGGAGQDQMQGADGDDIYYVDDEQDSVTETGDVIDRTPITLPDGSTRYGTVLATGGNDTVYSSVSHRMSPFVENLILTGSDAVNGYGSLFARQITGNDGGNDLYAYRLNGRADSISGSPVAITRAPIDGIQERLLDRALLALYRGDVNPIRLPGQPLAIELRAGEGVTLTGGAGNDRLFGDFDNDTLIGGAGDDLLYGLGGADVMIGGNGDDTYIIDGYMGHGVIYSDIRVRYIDNGGDILIEEVDGGNDTVISSINYMLGDNIENLTLSTSTGAYDQDVAFYGSEFRRYGYATWGAGNDLDNRILGNDYSVYLQGRGGNDYLEGGAGGDYLDGGTGVDVLYGSGGNDYYVVDNVNDAVIELEPNPWFGGFDTVEASFNYTLGDNLENLQLTGTDDLIGVGNELDNQIFGNDGNNQLYGYGGNDLLDGGLGADAMFGGDGDDQYYVDNIGDITDETGGGGIDEVFASITHILGTDIENLTLIGDDPIDGTGNDLDNRITGNWAANVLTGLDGYDLLDGGWGADTLIGGTGDDQYIVDDVGDVVVEDLDSGIDSVTSIVSYALSANVENLRLTGDGYINGYGNNLSNILIGNDYDNWLSGEGGDDWIDGAGGNDWLLGGAGNDHLYGGDDAMIYPYGQDGECDEEEGDCGGECYVTPNDDVLDGGAGDDTLDGGSGNDVLYGGEGNDFLYGGDDGLPAGICDEGEGIGIFLAAFHSEGGEGDGYGYFANPNDDQLFGGAGADILIGGSGNDLLDGGTELDTMAGGTGDDVYYVDGYVEIITVPPVGGGSGGGTTPGSDDGSCDPTKAKGNEGLGNGEDPPPPGHDDNWNDGEGTSPGDPGRKQDENPAGSSAHDSKDYGGSSDHGHDDEHEDDRDHDEDDHEHHNRDDHEDNDGCDHTDPVLCDVDPIVIPGMTGAGDPATIVIWHTDTVEEFADEGYDVVYSSVAFALPDNVEELVLIGDAAIDATGNAVDNYLGGNNADNTLSGLGGGDTLYGWGGNDRLDGGIGADWMVGGLGDDVYVVDDIGDQAIEAANAGADTVLAGIGYALGHHVENMVLTGDAAIDGTGNALNNLLVGNDAANILLGLEGNDSLYGRGGNDILDGGVGNDTYYITVNDGIDTLIDIDGDDTLVFGNCIAPERVAVRYATDGQGRAIASLRLLDAKGCESKTEGVDILLNGDGTFPIEQVRFADGTELTLDDLVVRSLTHHGTDKADTLATGRDDDTIHAGNGNDTVYAGSGHDTLYGGKGKDALNGGGGNDRLYGEDGDDVLHGGCGDDILDGGRGDNTLIGGAGNDLLLLGQGEDEIYFDRGDGWDTVRLIPTDPNERHGMDDDHDNEVRFGEAITKEQLWFERAGDDLVVRLLGTGDGMTIENWYNLERKPIEEFQTADGSELEARQIERLVQAMAQFAPSLGSDGILPTDQQQELNVVIAAAWERG